MVSWCTNETYLSAFSWHNHRMTESRFRFVFDLHFWSVVHLIGWDLFFFSSRMISASFVYHSVFHLTQYGRLKVCSCWIRGWYLLCLSYSTPEAFRRRHIWWDIRQLRRWVFWKSIILRYQDDFMLKYYWKSMAAFSWITLDFAVFFHWNQQRQDLGFGDAGLLFQNNWFAPRAH